MNTISYLLGRVSDLVNAEIAYHDDPSEMRRILRDKEGLSLRKHLQDALGASELGGIRPLPVPSPKIEGGASYTLRVVADSGYVATTTGRCTAGQYGAAIGALCGVTK